MTLAHVALRARLLPLLRAERVLMTRLMPAAAAAGASLREIENPHTSARGKSRSSEESGSGSSASVEVGGEANVESAGAVAGAGGVVPGAAVVGTAGGREVSVFAGSAWKTAFARVLNAGKGGSEKGAVVRAPSASY